MEKYSMYYDVLVKVTEAISQCKDTEEVAMLTAQAVKNAFNAKGCSVFLVNRKTKELSLAGSFGLSSEYLNKGPVHYMQELKEVKDSVPVAIHDVQDDPRIEYPREAVKEGIASILGVPIVSQNTIIGALRVYTADKWDFSIEDVTLVQAVAQICGMAMDMCRIYKGFKTSIEILKNMRERGDVSTKWTPYESVPRSNV